MHNFRRLGPLSLVLCLIPAGCHRSGGPPVRTASLDEGDVQARFAKVFGRQFSPVSLPDPGIAGYSFPEAEKTVERWAAHGNYAAIDVHAWGLWAALTQYSDQVYDGQKLRVFETWYDPQDLMALGPNPKTRAIRIPRRLEVPRQFQASPGNPSAADTNGQSTILAGVKYDPSASAWIVFNSLFSKKQLDAYLNAKNMTDIPNFQPTAVALKPVYRPLQSSRLKDGRYFAVNVWPGPPPLIYNKERKLWAADSFAEEQWGQCIWIDVQGEGNTGGGVDKTCHTRTVANTYGMDQFIHFQMSADEAAAANAELNELNLRAASDSSQREAQVSAGDFAVLLGMHVATREMTRWTWQTFWWTNTPTHPAPPSAMAAAKRRPKQIKDEPSHYAQCTAYQEVKPQQPLTGGHNADSVYCYNPYLEAKFSALTLNLSVSGTTIRKGRRVKTGNDAGVQTNCMSCHHIASYPLPLIPLMKNYTGDQYIDMNSPLFTKQLRTSFLWSLPDRAQ